jgi:hypothetical protein
MRQPWRRCALLLAGAACITGCSDSGTKPAPTIVDHLLDNFAGGQRTTATGARYYLATEDSLGQGFQLVIDTFSLTGPGVHTIREGDPGFAQATARLTNGHHDAVIFGVLLVTAGGLQRLTETFTSDAAVLDQSSAPDLAGYRLTAVAIMVDNYSLKSPGSDPNHDGNWTDVQLTSHLVIQGDSV